MNKLRDEYHIKFISIDKRIPWFDVEDVAQKLMDRFKSSTTVEDLIKELDKFYFSGRMIAWN